MFYHLASHIALAMIWQLVTLIASTNAQTELHPTQHNPSEACTRVPDNDESNGTPGAHFLCLSFEPLSSTAAEAASPLPFTLSAQQTSSATVSSTTIPQALNSTSNHDVSTTNLYTTLQDNEKTTSGFAPPTRTLHDQRDTVTACNCEDEPFPELDYRFPIPFADYSAIGRRRRCYQCNDVPSGTTDGDIHYDDLSFWWLKSTEGDGVCFLAGWFQ